MINVLIVDDSTDLLDFFSFLLSRKGFEVRTAQNLPTLQQQLKIFPPDIILMDVRLSRDDGRDLCLKIKQTNFGKKIHVLLLSASPELLYNYTDWQADGIIEKPFDIKTIEHKIYELAAHSIPE